MYRIINIKEDNPNSDYALFLLDQEINYSRAIGNRVVIVIHGYGSHGQGGIIKDAIKKYLPILKKKHIISDYVFGENWGEQNPARQEICAVSPELSINSNVRNINSGVSVVLI